MPGLIIAGAGGHGKVVADAAELTARWRRIAFIDDKFPQSRDNSIGEIIGTLSEAGRFLAEYNDIVVAIGDNRLRLKLIEQFASLGFSLPIIIHPSAVISKYAVIGEGTVVFARVVINTGAVLGKGCIANTAATVDHDCTVGDGVHLSPGVNLAGTVSVGANSWFGTNSCAIPGTRIGANSIIGAGAVVVGVIPDNVVAVGVPARIQRTIGGKP